MLKKALPLLLLFISLFLFISCDFLENELNLRSSGGGGGKGLDSTITVLADSVGKSYNSGIPLPDPPLTYTYSPDPLPDGVSVTGKLVRDSGEIGGTYVIRQGTLKLTGDNANKFTLKFVGNVFTIYGD